MIIIIMMIIRIIMMTIMMKMIIIIMIIIIIMMMQGCGVLLFVFGPMLYRFHKNQVNYYRFTYPKRDQINFAILASLLLGILFSKTIKNVIVKIVTYLLMNRRF